MVHAGGEDENRARFLRQAVDDIPDAVDEECLVVDIDEVFLLDFHGRKTVHRTHFRRREDDAAQAAGGTDIDLMRFRQLHARMDDIPGASCRRRVLERMGKRGRELGLRQAHAGAGGMAVQLL